MSNYIREYNKDKYKTVKLYFREENYQKLVEESKKAGYDKIGTYIQSIIKEHFSGGGGTLIELSNNIPAAALNCIDNFTLQLVNCA